MQSRATLGLVLLLVSAAAVVIERSRDVALAAGNSTFLSSGHASAGPASSAFSLD